jgi:GntR family transcriptional regulator
MPLSAAATRRRTPVRLVDGRMPTPLYHQVYLVLRDKIVSGAYGADGLLPGEPALVQQFGVSRITVKRALNDLAAEGFVRRRRGLGTRVVSGGAGKPVAGNMAGLIENLIIMGLATEVRLIEFAYVLPPNDVRRMLGLAEGERAQRAVRVRSQEGVPFSYLTTHVPEPIGRAYGRRELAATPLLTLLERAGAVAASADQALSARLADPTVAAHLEVEVGSPLLSLTRVVYDAERRPVEHILALYRPDRFEYRMSLARERDGARSLWAPPRAPRRQRRSRF